MPTTVHDAAEHFADSVSRGAPAATEAAQAAYVDGVRASYQSSKLSSYSQYRDLTGVPDPATGTYEDYPTGGTINDVKGWVVGGEYVGWDMETVTPEQLDRALYAYDQEIAGENRSTLLGWLENIPGVEQP